MLFDEVYCLVQTKGLLLLNVLNNVRNEGSVAVLSPRSSSYLLIVEFVASAIFSIHLHPCRQSICMFDGFQIDSEMETMRCVVEPDACDDR